MFSATLLQNACQQRLPAILSVLLLELKEEFSGETDAFDAKTVQFIVPVLIEGFLGVRIQPESLLPGHLPLSGQVVDAVAETLPLYPAHVVAQEFFQGLSGLPGVAERAGADFVFKAVVSSQAHGDNVIGLHLRQGYGPPAVNTMTGGFFPQSFAKCFFSFHSVRFLKFSASYAPESTGPNFGKACQNLEKRGKML
jgi:hypothetical protein